MRPSLAALFLLYPADALAQSRTTQLLAAARSEMSAHRLDSAAALLGAALAAASYLVDSAHILIWQAALEHRRGRDSVARARLRTAADLNVRVAVRDVDATPQFQAMFDEEMRARTVYRATGLREPPVWRSGPSVRYPRHLRHIAGRALVEAIVDTLGRVEPTSVDVLECPDTGFVEPLKQMMRAQVFSPGRHEHRAVRSVVTLGLNLSPPPRANPIQLVRSARDLVTRGRADSALELVDEALDPEAKASDGERMFALLVEGLAHRRLGDDSLAAASFDQGLALHRDLNARGVDLAPFLRRLADSIRVSRRGRAVAGRPPRALGTPSAVTAVDEAPALLSHPPVRYAPEMQALRIGGTLVVEATLDTSGRVVPASVRVVQSPNPVFDAEARRVVLAAVYRPARTGGRAVRVVIRQPITFAPY